MEVRSLNQYAPPAADPAGTRNSPTVDPVDRRELVKAVRKLEKASLEDGNSLFGARNEMRFQVDRDTKRTVIKIVSRQTGEVVQQFPAEEVLRMAARLGKQR